MAIAKFNNDSFSQQDMERLGYKMTDTKSLSPLEQYANQRTSGARRATTTEEIIKTGEWLLAEAERQYEPVLAEIAGLNPYVCGVFTVISFLRAQVGKEVK